MPAGGDAKARRAFQSQTNQPMSVVSTNHPRGAQLRRATYIHVADLTNAYNIDHARLEEELARVKEELENPVQETKNRSESLGSVPTELDTSGAQKRLHPPRGGNNMVVLVGKVRLVVNKNRVDGSRVRLAEVEIGDETGTVSLRARDEQIDMLEKISKEAGAVVLRNCTLELYQGKYIRVAVTKWGKMSKYPDQVPSTPSPPTKINRDRNFSLINLSLVATEWVQQTQHQLHQRHLGPDFDAASHQGSHSYQSHTPQSRRGRRSSRGGGQSGGGSAPIQYADVSGQYQQQHLHHQPAGAFVNDRMTGPQYYQMSRPHDSSPYQQQMMMQQYQLDSQQHQMHLYGGATPQQETPSALHPASPMFGIAGARSFDGGSLSSGSASRTMIPIHGTHNPASPQIQPTTNTTPPPISPGGMNADAASFDPTARFNRMHST